MATEILLKHPQSGLIKKSYYGFSWTSFFFGGFPALFRGDIGVGLGVIAATIVIGIFTFGVGAFIFGIVWAFIYNKIYTRKFIEKGYELTGSPEQIQLARSALGMIDVPAPVIDSRSTP